MASRQPSAVPAERSTGTAARPSTARRPRRAEAHPALDALDALPDLLTPAEVADLFRVDAKTVSRWAKAGKLMCIRTLGGHRRYPKTALRELLLEQLRAEKSAAAATRRGGER